MTRTQESSETITIHWENDPSSGNNGEATRASVINFTGTITDNDSAEDSATGKPGITGAAQVGMTLTAGTTNIMDTDGLNTPGYTYQWLRAGSNISGATSNTYTLTSSDYGETIQVKVNFTDNAKQRRVAHQRRDSAGRAGRRHLSHRHRHGLVRHTHRGTFNRFGR